MEVQNNHIFSETPCIHAKASNVQVMSVIIMSDNVVTNNVDSFVLTFVAKD